MKRVGPGQMEAVLALPGKERFEHFVKVVTDWEEAWGLYQDGWALTAAADGATVFPLWPAKEYAQLCAVEEWDGYEPCAVPLDELRDMLLPRLRQDGVLPGGFFTPSGKGVTPSVDQLQAALKEELDKY